MACTPRLLLRSVIKPVRAAKPWLELSPLLSRTCLLWPPPPGGCRRVPCSRESGRADQRRHAGGRCSPSQPDGSPDPVAIEISVADETVELRPSLRGQQRQQGKPLTRRNHVAQHLQAAGKACPVVLGGATQRQRLVTQTMPLLEQQQAPAREILDLKPWRLERMLGRQHGAERLKEQRRGDDALGAQRQRQQHHVQLAGLQSLHQGCRASFLQPEFQAREACSHLLQEARHIVGRGSR